MKNRKLVQQTGIGLMVKFLFLFAFMIFWGVSTSAQTIQKNISKDNKEQVEEPVEKAKDTAARKEAQEKPKVNRTQRADTNGTPKVKKLPAYMEGKLKLKLKPKNE